MKWLAFALLALCLNSSFAHEVRPGYLELREGSDGAIAVLWKTPMRGDMRLSLVPEFSGHSEALSPVISRQAGGAAIQSWRMRPLDPLRGQTLRIAGLERTMTDVLVHMAFADGTTWTQRLTPTQPAATVSQRESAIAVAGVYFKLGVEHILLGIDHLLFVLALLLITSGGWKLVKTVTAFTVAHSITLGLAALNLVRVPQAPVEAVIALSIVFVAAEILHAREGREGITLRAPWLVAFAFGLVHGFGFAGALREIGLPQGQIPVALAFFNAGVEVGQLLFIATVIAAIAGIRRYGRGQWSPPRWGGLVMPYAIGSVAMFWVIQRVVAF